MQQKHISKSGFSIIKRARSFTHAWRGIGLFVKTTHNSWVQIGVALLVIFFGAYFDITKTEWLFVVFSIGFVFVSEAFNSAIEVDMDLTSPEFHPYARDTKDIAAGAVLLASFTAIIVGVIVFTPYIQAIVVE